MKIKRIFGVRRYGACLVLGFGGCCFLFFVCLLHVLEHLGAAAAQTAAGVSGDLPVCLAALCMSNRSETKEAPLSFFSLFCINETL